MSRFLKRQVDLLVLALVPMIPMMAMDQFQMVTTDQLPVDHQQEAQPRVDLQQEVLLQADQLQVVPQQVVQLQAVQLRVDRLLAVQLLAVQLLVDRLLVAQPQVARQQVARQQVDQPQVTLQLVEQQVPLLTQLQLPVRRLVDLLASSSGV